MRRLIPLACLTLAAVAVAIFIGRAQPARAVAGTVTTTAGTNTFCGDGGPATSACLNLPVAVALDASGNLYITDNENQRIRKVTAGTTPTIATYAGSGLGMYCGDNAAPPAPLSACFDYPIGLVVDSSGNVYLADSGNDRVRKIAPDGTVTTFAGTGPTCTGTGDGGLATAACLRSPRGLALDGSGNLYIADALANRIRRVDHTALTISTYAGSGVAGFCGDSAAATAACLNHPRGIRFDSGGSLFIADELNNRIRRVDGASQVITTVAGNGTLGYGGDSGAAISAMLGHPRGVALDSANNLYIADSDNDRVREVVTGGDGSVNGGAGETISTLAGNGTTTFCGDNGPAASACMNSPDDLVVDAAGNLYVAASLDQRIRRVDHATLVISTYAGSSANCGDGGPAASACLNDPQGVERRGPTDPLYIADTVNHRVRVVNGSTISAFAGTGSPGYCGDGGPAASACLYSPRGLAVDAAGDVYIADTSNNRVRFVDHVTHNISTVAGNGSAGYTGDGGAATTAALNFPRDVFVDAAGNLWISDTNNNVIREVTPGTDGVVNAGPGETISTVAGNGTAADCLSGSPATSACLKTPGGIFVDSGGLLIADAGNQKVKLVNGGVFTTIAGTGVAGTSGDGGAATAAAVHEPSSVVKDTANNLFISEHSSDRIRKVVPGLDGQINGSADETITTVAGGATSGFCGDGGAATSACLSLPRSIALDSAGNLYVADQGNRRIRTVAGLGVPPPATPTPTSTAVPTVVVTPVATPVPCGPDTNGDGIPDCWETKYACLNVAAPNPSGDPDADGVSTLGEYWLGTNPCNPDTDGDGYLDGPEVSMGKNPLVYCATMRADINGDAKVNLLDLGAVALTFGEAIPPAPTRYDQNTDNKINLLDLGTIALRFGHTVAECP